MKILSPRVHGYLDYVVVVAFLLAPTLLGLRGTPAILCYILAAVHLTLTLMTAFPLGLIKAIPFTVHGMLELIVAIALIAVPWLLGFASEIPARTFYVAAGIVILAVWAVTDYKAAAAA